MKRLILLLILPLLACSGLSTTRPSTPIPASATQTDSLPSTASDTSIPTPLPFTDTPNATTFPDPNAYTWQPVIEVPLQRPVDLQADGSGRLLVIEKLICPSGVVAQFCDPECRQSCGAAGWRNQLRHRRGSCDQCRKRCLRAKRRWKGAAGRSFMICPVTSAKVTALLIGTP